MFNSTYLLKQYSYFIRSQRSILVEPQYRKKKSKIDIILLTKRKFVQKYNKVKLLIQPNILTYSYWKY